MTIRDAIDRADRIRPNAVHPYDKRLELHKIESQISEMMEVEEPEWPDSEEDYELILQDPYSEVYVKSICAYIDWVQEETDLYQIDMIMANQAMAETKAWYRRNNREKGNTKFKGVFI